MANHDANTSHSGAGGFDLLKRATQAMMMSSSSRPSGGDDDGTDQIGTDTPRSGVATPQPDLHDKRRPGIMSYFGQVRADSVQDTSLSSLPTQEIDHISFSPNSTTCTEESLVTLVPPNPSSSSPSSTDMATALTPQNPMPPSMDGCHSRSPLTSQRAPGQPDRPPTPQESRRSSGGLLIRSLSVRYGDQRPAVLSAAWPLFRQKSTPIYSKSQTLTKSSISGIATASVAVHASHLSNPSVPPPPDTLPVQAAHITSPKSYSSLEKLKRLTQTPPSKSGQSTPTRALSSARPSQLDEKSSPKRSSNETAPPSGTQTPRGAGTEGAQVPAAKGKLTVRIVEGKNLRKARDPYVVVTFQRSELISAGPQSVQDEDDEDSNNNLPTPGIPIQRQGSDSGRPAVSIPMRSRQSSNTSLTEYNSFRNRTKQSFSGPVWDAEAIYDVVDSDMLVNVSVYDHTANGENFLGHVDITASMDHPVRGWFPIVGHIDTMAENAPTGELYVETSYQRTERKHFGPEDFQILKLIGKGTFGQVYQVRKKDTGRIYAMKVLSKKVIVQKKEVAHTVGERNILVRTATTDSPFIVGLKFSFQTPSDLYLVTDYMSGGELFWHLQKEGRFDEKRAKFYIAELILAIQHLHRNDIVYRDLKPENILLDANGHIALCDFGLSKANLTKNDTTNTFCGTTEYLAPEVLLDESGYTKMVDFWSLGVLVFEMCCGWSPFYAEDTQQMYKNIAFGKVRFPRDTLSQEGRNFVKGLLNRNPKHRLGATDDAEELMRHPFFDDIDWSGLGKKLITPPFKPKLASATDVSYFDPEFTNALDNSGSLNERAAALAKGFATSTPLSPSVQANFQGFTFVDESALDDHMRDRRMYDDEEMSDARHDDWDTMRDAPTQKTNRMSGIETTNNKDSKDEVHDDQMIGSSHFDV